MFESQACGFGAGGFGVRAWGGGQLLGHGGSLGPLVLRFQHGDGRQTGPARPEDFVGIQRGGVERGREQRLGGLGQGREGIIEASKADQRLAFSAHGPGVTQRPRACGFDDALKRDQCGLRPLRSLGAGQQQLASSQLDG